MLFPYHIGQRSLNTTSSNTVSDKENNWTIVAIVGGVCSIVFITMGFVLGVMCLYITLRMRGRLSGPTPPSPPPTAQEEDIYDDVKAFNNYENISLKLTSNTAYGHLEK